MFEPKTWKVLKYAAAACLLALVAACTVPMGYERETGTEVNLLVAGELEPAIEELRGGPWTLSALNISTTEGEPPLHEITARLLNAERSDLGDLERLEGLRAFDARTLVEAAEGTLYDMMVDRLFSVSLDVGGLNDEEINRLLNERLAASGFEGAVTVSRGAGAEGLQLEVEVPEDESSAGAGEAGLLEIKLFDGEAGSAGAGRLQDLNLDLSVTGEMSEEQIREMVREQLEAQGVDAESARILIRRNEDGSGDSGMLELEVRAGAGGE